MIVIYFKTAAILVEFHKNITSKLLDFVQEFLTMTDNVIVSYFPDPANKNW